MQFGNDAIGSGQNDPGAGIFHDSSFKANDKIFPRTVVISAGGSVDFEVDGFHQVAVCNDGVGLSDVNVPVFTPPATNLFVDDAANCPTVAAPTQDALDVSFAEPGRYLIICNVTPHLTEARQFGYVIVK